MAAGHNMTVHAGERAWIPYGRLCFFIATKDDSAAVNQPWPCNALLDGLDQPSKDQIRAMHADFLSRRSEDHIFVKSSEALLKWLGNQP